MRLWVGLAAGGLAALALAGCGGEQQAVLNVYSARHYDSDDAFYAAFEAATGARVRRIEADGDLLIEKIRAEGAASPADVVITVDLGRLQRAEEAGLFQPIHSGPLEAAIPAHLRHPEGYWFAFAKRARVIVYREGAIDPQSVDTYEELADPALAGRICVRSSSNIYNVSLLSALIARWGPERAEAWAREVRNNFARLPTGGDTDQIAAVSAGECDVAIVNHYYYARMASGTEVERAATANVKLIWPDQDGPDGQGAGAHVNISGAGVAANAPNPALAQRFLEFMLEPAQQEILSAGSYEYPILAEAAHPEGLDALGVFREEEINVSEIGARQAEASRIFDAVGWP
jgi:iron(III) transport system substrate-binding protein